MSEVLAYFITWTCYGTWLPGDDRGSVFGKSRSPEPYETPNRGLHLHSRKLLEGEPLILNREMRAVVHRAIEDHCDFRGWRLLALNVRSNHVHVVVVSDIKPELVMSQFKSWATRRLRESSLTDGESTVWTKHGSTRYLTSNFALKRTIQYTLEEQDSRDGHPDSG